MNKKAQITLFIIIGIVILIITVGIVYMSGYKFEKDLQTVEQPMLEDIPKEANPVRFFVTQCLERTAENAFTVLGSQGGYIETQSLSPRNIDPTNADSIKFGAATIPYWHYLKSNNRKSEYKFSSAMPSTVRNPQSLLDMSVQAQVDRYVENNLKICLNNFNQLKEQGFTISTEIPKVTTSIRDTDVLVKLNYPMHVRKSREIHDLEEFYTILPVNFKKIFEMANTLTQMHEQFNYTETTTMNLISTFSTMDQNKLPPIRATSNSRTFWIKQNVKNTLTEILITHLPKIQIVGTENYVTLNTQPGLDTNAHEMFNINILDLDYKDLEINHIYNRFPIYFDIANVQGEQIGPSSMSQSFLGFSYSQNDYVAKYDISYPIIVEIKDTEAFEKQGYNFFFALESNIRNNRPIRDGSSVTNLDVGGETLLCDPALRATDLIKVEAQEDMDVYYQCGTEVSCHIGKTDSAGVLEKKFPICQRGGIVRLKGENYLGESRLLDTNYNQKASLEFELQPVHTLNAEIQVIDKSGNKRALNEDEQAMLTISRIKENALEDDLEDQTFVLKKGETDAIKLTKGKYDIDGIIMYNKEFSVTTSFREGGWRNKERTITSKIEPGMPIGGALFELELSETKLKDKNKVTFYLKTPYNIPKTTGELGAANEVEKYSKITELRPRLE